MARPMCDEPLLFCIALRDNKDIELVTSLLLNNYELS